MTNSVRATREPWAAGSLQAAVLERPCPTAGHATPHPVAELTHFSTQPYQPSLRFSVWLDCLRRFFGDIRADARAGADFDARLQSIYENGVAVTRMCAGAQSIEHRESAQKAEHRGFLHVVAVSPCSPEPGGKLLIYAALVMVR